MSHQKFIETLVAQQSLRENDLNKVTKIQQQMQETRLPLLLVRLGLCSEKDVANALAKITGLSIVTVEEYPDTPVLPDEISLRFLKEFHVVGIKADEQKIIVAVMDPENPVVEQSLRLLCETEIEVKIGILSDIDKTIERQYVEGKTLEEIDESIINGASVTSIAFFEALKSL